MLKRQQVLLEDWLVDYAKYLSQLYDLSFSEIIRLSMCIEYLDTISRVYTGFKPTLTKPMIMKKLADARKKQMGEEKIHQMVSKTYFEARKAIEFRMNHDNKIKNRQTHEKLRFR